MSEVVSERLAWAAVATRMRAILRAVEEVAGGKLLALTAIRYQAGEVIEEAAEMLRQLDRGIHENPPLVFYGNPPLRARRGARGAGGSARIEMVETMSEDVHAVRYEHVQDGKPYEHKFDPGASMDAAVIGGRRVIVIARPDGKPVWEDF